MADRTGQQFGNYRLVSLLGQGGYAEVYLGPAPAAQSASGHQGAACPSDRDRRPSTSSRKRRPSPRSPILGSCVSSITMCRRACPFW